MSGTVAPLRVHWSEAGPELAAELAAFAAMAFDPHFREAWNLGQITGLLESGAGWAIIGRDQYGEMLAFALSRIIVDETELLLCATHPRVRCRGLGRQLVEQVRQSAIARGCRQLFLEVREGNLPALALYRTMQFTMAGRRKGYYATASGERLDALTLQLMTGSS